MLADQIADWIRTQVLQAGLDGVVVALSGGIDSAVVTGLCARALGARDVLGLILPCYSNPVDAQDAELVADVWGIPVATIDLGPAYDALLSALPAGSDLANANIKPRLRMITLYHYANTLGRMVVGTGNRSELMVGYYTKYGDGGVDLLPLAGIYKHQVRDVARDIGVPQRIIDRPPSAGLWEGQTDEAEMGISYAVLDATLEAIQQGDTSSVDPEVLRRVSRMIAGSEHKRRLAPIFTPSS